MKRFFVNMLGMSVMLLSMLDVQGQLSKMMVPKTLPITTSSAAAKELAKKGTAHFMNIEFAQAYNDFSAALKLDHDFTFAQVFMSFLTRGDVSKQFADKAMGSAKNKSAGEKLFASVANQKNTDAENRDIWTKLHAMYPDCALSGTYYAITKPTADERFAAAQDYIKKFPSNAWMYNFIAYYYMNDKKDMESAKKNFEKYIELYPDGSNPYDSMGEFYLNNSDTANAEKYYTRSLEKYPFSVSSINALDKINAARKKTVN